MALRIWVLAPFILCLSSLVSSSHFRGGIIQWRPLNAQNFDGRIEISFRMAWRRSWSGNGCTSSDIGTTRLFGLGSLSCQSGCSGTVGSLQFYCTDFSTAEDWVAGSRTYTYNIGTSLTRFEASYGGGCWIGLRAGGCSWEIRVKGSLSRRSDNNRINSSPVTTTTPIVRLQSGCRHTIRIPVQDADQDIVRCRWAAGNECGDVCSALPGATIDSNTCVLTWTAPTTTGWYAVAVQIEDFISSSSTVPLSSVPLQFLINVFSNNQPCTGGIRPSLVPGETPADGSCIPVPFGTTYRAGLVAASGGASVSIVRFSTASPLGLRQSAVTRSSFNTQHYYINVTWTPTSSQFGLNQFCFRAVSSNQLESNQSCITLLGGVTGPSAQSSSVSPIGRFSPTASTLWSITFDQAISRPSSSRYIRFYNAATRQNVYSFDVRSSGATFPASGSNGRVLSFRFSFGFTAGASYYVLLDSGVAVGAEFCNQESLAVTSTTFWTFSTGCAAGFTNSGGTCVDINECSTGAFTCPANSGCVNTIGSYTCRCNTGFESSGSSCIDINECSRGLDRCHAVATCTNTIGSYTCTCPSGTAGNGFTCTDLCNECSGTTGSPAGCGTHNCNISTSDCTNTIGSFQCTCRFGLAADGISCIPPPRPDPPTSVRITVTGATTITIVWQAPVASIGNRISSYTITLTETGGSSITQSVTTTSYTFTGLQEYRTYSCVIVAVSLYGPVSVATAAVSTTTLQTAPSAPPVGFNGTATSPRSAVLTWSTPPADDINGVIIRYVINVTVVETGQMFQLFSPTTTLSITTLSPYRTFICIIAAQTSAGLGPFSTRFTLVTPQDAPSSPPRNVVLTPASSTSITLSWNPPVASDINGVIVEYRISITEVLTGRVFNFTSTTTSFTAPGLHPYYQYECIVSAFTVGSGPYSQVIRITTPEDVPSGSPLNFGGSATTSRSATITWNPPRADLQNGIIVSYVINVTVRETGATFQLTSSTTSLTITTLSPYRNYVCIIAAVTSVGTGPFSGRFTLTTPEDIPTRPPQTPSAVTRNSRTLYCTWSPPPTDHQNGRIVEYRVNMTEVLTGRMFVRVTTSTSLEITSLHPDYVYQWVVTAVTIGVGPYSSVTIIKTPEDAPSGPPQSITATALSALSIQINWQAPLLPDQNGRITGYVINVTSLNTGVIQQFTSVNTTLQIASLTPFTNYVCVVAARTAIGVGPFSTVINVQTLEAAPGSHPSNFTGMSLNSTHIYLTWEPPPPSQVNGVIREYRLNVTEDVTGQLFQYTTTPTNRQIIVGPLHPYYIYHCSVVALTVQLGPYTSLFTIQTQEDVPSGPPTSLVTVAVDSRSISLTWAPPQADQQNGIIRHYIVNLTSHLPTVTGNISSSQLSVTIGGLRPYTLYSCVVQAGTVGLGPPTVAQQVLTPQDVPSGPPQNLNLTANSSRSLILSWDTPLPQDVNGIITDYTINLTSALGASSFRVGSNVTTYTLRSLQPFILYSCVIAAHTSVGRGPFSANITLTTPEDAPEAPPTSITQNNVMSRSVDISWVAPRTDRQNGVIRYYSIEAYENDTGNTLMYQTPSSQVRFMLNNLHPHYTYTVRVRAVTVSPGPLSLSFTVNTLQDIPTAAPIAPYGFPISASLITLNWTQVPDEHLNGVLLFYLVEVTEIITNTTWTFHAVQTHINIGPLHAYYTYRCRLAAFNSIGVGPYTAFFYVNSGEAIPTGAPLNVTFPRTTTTTLTLSWDPPRYDLQNGLIRYYMVYVSDLTNGTSWDFTTNMTRVVIDNLQPFYQYNCSVAAFTIDLGPVSDPVTVRLPQTPPSVAPTNVRGFAIDHSSISLEWDAPPTLLLNGILRAYIINVTERETGDTFEVNTTNTSIILTSLHPDYVYECRVAAATIGPGPFSPVFAVQVLMAAPSGAPDNITAVAVSSTEILVMWDLPLPERRNGPILAYNITVTDAATGLIVRFSTILTTSVLVSSLRPFSSYNFTLSARTSVGYGPNETISQMTLQDIPSSPTSLRVDAVSGDPYSLRVNWQPPAVPNGYITYYNVYCQESQIVFGSGSGGGMPALPTSLYSAVFSNTVYGSELNATISGLVPFTNYGCFVSANTSIGEGSNSTSVFQTTDEYIPVDTPSNLQVSIVNATSVYLSWSPPTTPYGNIVYYTILIEEALVGGNVTTVVAMGTSSTLVELIPYTYYNFSVAASTRIGTGPFDAVSIQTPQASPYGSPLAVVTRVGGTTSANTSWAPPDPNLQNGIVTYYTVVLTDLSFGMPDRVYNTTALYYEFTGLEEYGRYAFQVAAGTQAGLGPLSTAARFTTLEDIPTAPPQNVRGTALSSSLIMLIWSPPPPLETNGAIRYYTVEATERYTGRQWTFFAVDADLHLGSLHPYYYYDFNVSATTIGMGPFSARYSVLTLPEAPTAPPEQLSPASITPTSLTLSWNPPPFEDTNGPIQYYTVSVTEVDTNTTFSARNSFTTQITYNNLHPYYIYRCIVAAYTVGIGPFSQAITVQLAQAPPTAPPMGLSGASISSDSISVSWNPPLVSERNGMIQHYLVNVTEVVTGNMIGHVALYTNFTLLSLHPYYTYIIVVSAVTISAGPATSPIMITTDQDAPSGPAQNLNTTVVSSEEAVISWDEPDPAEQNGIITGYVINITIIGTGQTIQMTSTTTELYLTDLMPFTTYSCRIAARTSVGVGPFSSSISFLTEESAPSSPPQNVSGSPVSSTSVRVTWDPPPLASRNGIITGYRLNVTETDTGRVLLYFSATTSFVAQNLHPYYTYLISVRPTTVATGPPSAAIMIRTPEDIPSGFPQNFTRSVQSPTSIRFNWSAPAVEERNGVIVSYTVNITETGSGRTIQRTVPSSQTYVSISSLLPFTTYDFSIAASTSVGVGPFSTILTLTMPEDSPDMSPANLTGSVQDSTTIQLSWDAPAGRHNGIIREYRINITEVDTGRRFQEISAVTTLTISNLHPDYTYEWRVTAFTVGESPYSATSSLTTIEDVPSGPPTRVTSSALTSDSILVSWAAPLFEERNGDITGYIINVTNLDSGATQQFTTTTPANFTVPNLRPFTVYVVIISARTAVGMGPFSGVVSVQTLEDAPGSHPLNSTGYALNSTHIFLDWSPPSLQDVNGIIREYRINVTEGETNTLQQLTTDPQTTEILVGPLHPFYTYHCTILAFTVEGGPNTTVISIRTHEAAPSGPPTSVTAMVTSTRSVSMTWAPPVRDQQNGIVRHYFVTLRSTAGTVTRNISSVQQTITVSGLRPYTVYNCTVQAETVGLGPYAAYVQVTTPQDVPTGPPQSVAAQVVGPTAFNLTWSPPVAERQNGLIQLYVVSVIELGSRTTELFNTTVEWITITGRLPFRRYSFTVAAVTIGQGPFSVASIIHLPEAAPSSSPEGVQSSQVTSSSFLLSWSAPLADNHNGVIRNYTINITEENTGRQLQFTSNTNSLRVESLHPYYNYTSVVSAVTVALGPFSQPIFITTLQDVPTGSPINFVVMAISSTSIFLTWDPPPLQDQNGIITTYTITVGNTSTLTTSALMLTVENLRPFTPYTFNVAASTIVGHGPSTADVEVTTLEDAPEGAPANVISSSVTSTSLTLTWDPPQNTLQNGVIRHYLIIAVETNTGANFTFQARAQTRPTFSIGDLHPYYTYQINVYAVTVEVGPASPNHTVTTLQDVPSSAPVSISASAVDSRTLRLSWAPPPPSAQNGIITEYVVNVSVQETGEMLQRRAMGSATSLSIAALHPDYTYTYVVAASTAIGRGPFSISRSIRMPEDVPTSPPRNTTGSASNSTAILFTWEHPPPEGRNGMLTGYSLVVTELATNTTTTYRQSGDRIELVVAGLHPYYEYQCAIAAETRVGRGPYGAPFITRTLADAPSGVPRNVVAVAVTSRSIQVTWEAPEEDQQNGVIQRYMIMVMVQQTRASLSLNTTSTSITIPDLHPAYDHSIEVAAVTVRVGPYSAVISVTTPDDAPTGAPVSVTTAAISSTSIRITWQAPLLELQNGEITSYRITVLELETGAVRNFSTVPTDSIYVINSLHPFYNYNCSVAAFTNALGPISYSLVQTLPEEPSESPINVTVLPTNASSVIASWTPPAEEDRNGIIQGYTIRVVGVQTDEDFTLSVATTETVIGSLHPFYTYKFTVATVTISHGPFSNPVTVQMPPLAPSQPVQNVTAEPTSPTSLRVRWYPSDLDDWNGIITRYTIEYSLIRPVPEDSDGDDDDDEGPSPDRFMMFIAFAPTNRQLLRNNPDPRLATTPLVWEELELVGLQEYFIYSVSIFYENEAGRSASTEPVSVNMPPGVPTGPPIEVSVTALSQTAIVIQWDAPEQFEQNGPIIGYEITLIYKNGTQEKYRTTGDTYSIQIEGLPKFASLNISVAARTSVGLGPASNFVAVTTFPDVPEAPSAVKATVLEKGSVELAWSPPSQPNGVLLGYQIIYYGYKKEQSTRVSRQIPERTILDGPRYIPVPADQTTYQVDDLQTDLIYVFKVRARTTPGFGPNSTEVSVDLTQDVTESSSDQLAPVQGSNATVTAVIILAVIGWILFMIVIILVVAALIWRRKRKTQKTLHILSERYKDTSGVGVHNTNFYEVEGETKINPVEGLELEDAAFGVQNKVYDLPVDKHSLASETARLEFKDDGCSDEPVKLDLAASESEDDDEDDGDSVGEITKIDLGKESARGEGDNEVVFKVEFEKDDDNEIDYL